MTQIPNAILRERFINLTTKNINDKNYIIKINHKL